MANLEPIKVGQTVWLQHGCDTRYTEFVVLGETSRSWLVKTPTEVTHTWSQSRKIPKTLVGWSQSAAYDAKLFAWAMDNRWKIAQAFDVCCDASLILAMARALKHELSLKELPQEGTQ